MERTLVFLKPEAVIRRSAGARIIKQLMNNFKIIYFGEVKPGEEFLASKHYGEHVNKPFFKNLITHVTVSPLIVIILEGENVVERVRKLVGATFPENAEPGTVRYEYGLIRGLNCVHASASVEDAEKEIRNWLEIVEISEKVDYEQEAEKYVNKYLNHSYVEALHYRKLKNLPELETRKRLREYLMIETDFDEEHVNNLINVILNSFRE